MTDQKNKLKIFDTPARPFLKWAGGKTQLLPEIIARLPPGLAEEKFTRYIEPFVGGGAVFFSITQNFPVKQSVICDVNRELIMTYRVIQCSVTKLIAELESLELNYFQKNEWSQEKFYYSVRKDFNERPALLEIADQWSEIWIERAAQMIFLNKTCFNGLYRVNANGKFNVPFGRYKRPAILNDTNLLAVSNSLKKTTILLGDFKECQKFINNKSFVYLDPPYRPLMGKLSFTAYSNNGFNEIDQNRLAMFFRRIDHKFAKVMLSNSDPGDEYFDQLYSDYNIERVPAKRAINCKGTQRGPINELIITNYPQIS